MPKSEAKVEELVAMIERGELRLPEMQRRYVWRSTRVRDLLDSLYRGYPSGAILLWETDENVPLQEFAISQPASPYQSTKLLLDGQQRLTSLSSVIRGEPVKVRGRKKPIEILFNLEHPDELSFVTEVNEDGDDIDEDDNDLNEDEADVTEDDLQKRFNNMTFVVSTRKLAKMPQWVKVTEVLRTDKDVEFLKGAGVMNFDDPRYEKYSERLARLRGIKKYVYRMDILERGLSYQEVTEIFVRVNSLGAKLRSSDLALAQITAKWRGALDEFKEFEELCANTGFGVDLGIHLKNLIAFATGQSRFISVPGLRIPDLQEAWQRCKPGMEFAMNFIKNNVGIDSPSLLSSPFVLIAVAFYGDRMNYQLTSQQAKELRYWILVANAKGRYSRGSSETILDQDLAVIRQGGSISDLVERLRLQVGRLDIEPEELEGRNQKSALFKTMFLAFRHAGAKDWESNLTIALNHRGASHRLQFHHIFPKGVLKGTYTSREINDIANMAFIGGKTNRKISNKAPVDYFPLISKKSGDSLFHSQCIPTDPNLLMLDSYKMFLAERRRIISDRLNEFILM